MTSLGRSCCVASLCGLLFLGAVAARNGIAAGGRREGGAAAEHGRGLWALALGEGARRRPGAALVPDGPVEVARRVAARRRGRGPGIGSRRSIRGASPRSGSSRPTSSTACTSSGSRGSSPAGRGPRRSSSSRPGPRGRCPRSWGSTITAATSSWAGARSPGSATSRRRSSSPTRTSITAASPGPTRSPSAATPSWSTTRSRSPAVASAWPTSPRASAKTGSTRSRTTRRA